MDVTLRELIEIAESQSLTCTSITYTLCWFRQLLETNRATGLPQFTPPFAGSVREFNDKAAQSLAPSVKSGFVSRPNVHDRQQPRNVIAAIVRA